MITTNTQKKTLIDRLYRDNHITLDEVIMLLDDEYQYVGSILPRLVTPAVATTSQFPSGVITNLSGTVIPTSI